MQHYSGFQTLCETARQHVKEITVTEVKALMDKGDLPVFIDVREDNEWQNDHIPQAKHLSRGIIERDIETVVPDKNAVIVLYCGGGYRSVLSAESLEKMGYQHVFSMVGGYRGWKEAGYPLMTD